MKKMVTLLLVLVMIFSFASCGNNDSEGDAAAAGAAMAMDNETLVYGSGDYTAINPALYEHGEINALLFAGMTAHDADNKVVAGLAEDWTT